MSPAKLLKNETYTQSMKKNIPTTKKVTPDEIMIENKDIMNQSKEYLPPTIIKNKEHIAQVTAVNFTDLKGMVLTDQTWAFPITLAVMKNNYPGPVLGMRMKPRKEPSLSIHHDIQHINGNRNEFNFYHVEKEYSTELIYEIESKRLKSQIVLPGSHRTLPTERAIKTFKNHFESILYGCGIGLIP